MQFYKNQFELLKNTKNIIKESLPKLGINKKQELIRLLYEVSKKQKINPSIVLSRLDSRDFKNIKKALLDIRYPSHILNKDPLKIYLSKLNLDSSLVVNCEKRIFYPKKVFVEKKANLSVLLKKFKKYFPKSLFIEIPSLKHYLKDKKSFSIETYNKRSNYAFITHENYDFFKRCPCTKGAIGCGYHIFNLSFGCIYECTYCYLQEYTNSPGIIFPSNVESFFKSFPRYKKPLLRIGTGEFSDSLMLDNLTEYSLPIIDFFKKYPEVQFEFKTKSTNIDNLLKIKHAENIIVGWSLNPQKIINENEFFTSPLLKIIKAAEKCAKNGYKLAFHFDPVIYFKGYKEEYKKIIEILFSKIKPKSVAWISIGTLRFKPSVKNIIEKRFPDNKILDEELIYGYDNKLRYPERIRYEIYNNILTLLQKHSKKIKIYLCMEKSSMWQDFKDYLSLP